ncbi:MAG: nucleotidyltransferase domain-containing protein [Candidatus Nanoarchaeia archaeon]|nr:nucleotidyltransferase domain-containing protein [Candidatus Nanoarchaeia archaeon]MDD5357807.1 nucleotidyltransferase domain-containing protein [Candidatus Nanoarchaeia archaeon]MDD5588726.1 nucleotidyltransferase domain-containing protein [Candidatus Nanoarchaeia archaeon]
MKDETKESGENDIPEMELDNKYSDRKDFQEHHEDIKKDMDKTKKEIEKVKSFILKKYPFTQVVSILPPQSIKHFIDEEEVPKETEKHIHLLVVVPEENMKESGKIKTEIVKQIEELKQKIWLHLKSPNEVWELCLDSKFELVTAIAMSFPLHDTGVLGALRVAEIHKSLVLQKFEKYVVSYVIAGSLVRGEAVPTSDVDVFIIINDTDVKRMPRLELKERLRSIIYQYVAEASQLAGVQNKLSPQVYLLTDFWESVKDAHPVIFTFIRDGIPIYDRGTFMPWKSLLRMGKLKPSPEAIDMFMSMGDKTVKRVKSALLDVVVNEIFWGVTTPSQALLMLYGLPPPTPKHVASEMKRIFVDKEKMLEKKYITIIEKVVGIYKDYEHEKIKEISGEQIDKLVANVEDFLKRLKELREQIEKREQEKTIEQIYKDVFTLLKSMIGNKAQDTIVEEFEKQFVKKAKFAPQHLRILKDIIHARTEFKKGKSDMHKVDEARKNASILINDIIEYNQRCELMNKKKE